MRKKTIVGLCLLLAVFFVSFSGSARGADIIIDGTVNTTSTSHTTQTQRTVFTTSLIAYTFYRDADGRCVYSKSTDGGATWGARVRVDAQTDCFRVAIWYDRWTPGDTTGNYIHIGTIDDGNDDIWYNRLDTTTDTLLMGTAPVSVSGAQGGSFNVGINFQSIIKASDGKLFMAVTDTTDSYVVRCTANCNLAASWSEAGPNPFADKPGDDPVYLMPTAGGNVLVLRDNTSIGDFESKVWNAATNSWSAAWTAIDLNAQQSTTYRAAFSLTTDPYSGNIYLAYAADTDPLGTNDDVRTAIYSATTGTWALRTAVLNNDARGVTGVSIFRDSNLGDVYVAYTAQTTAGTPTTANVYWKKSTDNMLTWGPEQGPINDTPDDIYGVSLNFLSSLKVHVTWVGATPDDLLTTGIVTLTPPTFEQSAYRWYSNTDTTDVGPALSPQDAATGLGILGSSFRLRALVHVTGDGIGLNMRNFKLQYVGKGSGTCASPSGGTPSSYTDMTTSTLMAFYDNPTPADGVALTANASDPTHSGHTIRKQSYEESNNFTNAQFAVIGGEDAMWDLSLRDNGAPASTSYCFRIVQSDGTLLDTYTVYPQITTGLGTLGIDIVDAGGLPVANPYVDFPAMNFSFDAVQSLATLGTTTQKIRVSNSTATPQWNVTIGASGAGSALWTDGTETYDYNDTAANGRLRLDPSVATVTPRGGCSLTGITKGSAANFNQGVVDSITLLTAGASANTACYWDITGIALTQDIPESQPPGVYAIDFILTVS